jgi:hypothetical protein
MRIMCYENFSIGQLNDLFGYFVEFRSIFYHFIGNACHLTDIWRDIALGIDQRLETVQNLLPIVDINGDFGDSILYHAHAGGLDIYDCKKTHW